MRANAFRKEGGGGETSYAQIAPLIKHHRVFMHHGLEIKVFEPCYRWQSRKRCNFQGGPAIAWNGLASLLLINAPTIRDTIAEAMMAIFEWYLNVEKSVPETA